MKKIIIILHFILTLLAWTSCLYLSWNLIALLSLLHIAMLETWSGCFLSHYQFKDKESTNTRFYEWWLGKIGIKNYNREKLRIFMTYWVPIIIIAIAIIVQSIFRVKPLI